ncbi:MAG: cytochrome c-type biogenesis protein CcmH [Myxococcales bacterium]|nr:MAG: cytochrome c-type biogenesis protein CcmH [Myxococcales bacterium]
MIVCYAADMFWQRMVLCGWVFWLCFVQFGWAQDSSEISLSVADEQRASRINEAVLSPFCPGQTLATCPSPNAKVWREDIKRWVKAGVPSRDIAQRLQARIPEKNLSGLPPNRWDWLLPAFGLGLASLLLFFIIWRLRFSSMNGVADGSLSSSNPEPRQASTDEKLDARLDEELKQL